jgi:hypothetical protein
MFQFVSQWAFFFRARGSPTLTAVEVEALLYTATNTNGSADFILST